MHICFINHYFVPPSQPGGTRHFNLAKHLVGLGHQVTIFAANYNHYTHQYIHPEKAKQTVCETYDGVTIIWLSVPAYKENSLKRLWNMFVFAGRLCRKKHLALLGKPDVIIGSSPHLFAALAAKFVAWRTGSPFILEVRDLWPESLVALGRISAKHPMILLMNAIEKFLYKTADRIITLLPGAKDYIHQHGAQQDKIHCLPNFVDSQQIPRFDYPHRETFTFMYAGSHGVANNLDVIVEAAALLLKNQAAANIHIRLVGNGPQKPQLQQKARALTNISFQSPVAKEKIYQVLDEADAYIMLLKNSPVFQWGVSPNKLFDYMGMARPVIYGINTAFNPIESEHAGLSVTADDPKALANAMLKLAMTPVEERQAMGQRGQCYIEKYHDVRIIAASLHELILSTGKK